MSRKLWVVRSCVGNLALVLIFFLALRAHGDALQMQNGDHYFGKVISMTTNIVVLQSEVLGTVTLPRSKIALLTLGSNASTNLSVQPLVVNGQIHAAQPSAAGLPKIPVATTGTGGDKNLLTKVESQYLSEATPE